MSQIVTTPDGTEHEFPDNASPAQIRAALSSYIKPVAQPSPSGGMPLTTMGLIQKFLPALTAGKAIAASQGPNLGGGIGALAGMPFGWPGRVIGAGLGGAAGSLGSNAALGHPLDPRQALTQAGIQAGMQGLGEGINAGELATAKGAMSAAVNPTEATLKTNPNVIGNLLQQRIAVGKGVMGKVGSEATQAGLNASVASRNNALDQMGRTFKPADWFPDPESFVPKISGERDQEVAALQALKDKYLSNYPDVATSNEAFAAKQDLQNRAFAKGRQVKAGATESTLPIEQQYLRAAARRARGDLGEDINNLDAKTQQWIGMNNAINRAEMAQLKGTEARMPGSIPMLGKYAIPPMFRNRWALSRLAMLASNPALLTASNQAPRLASIPFYSAAADATQP